MLWIYNIITDIPGQYVKVPINIFADNQPSINLANNYTASKFTRHIGIRHHFLRDHCYGGNKMFNITYIKSEKNFKADGMTKPLTKTEFIKFKSAIVSDYTI